MLSDEWLQRYRLLENFTAKWNGNGNGNAYDRGDYNSSFALRAVELKNILHGYATSLDHRVFNLSIIIPTANSCCATAPVACFIS